MKNLKKFTIKAISMILMLAMTLSVTAMAAYTPLKSDTDPNAYAFKNYLHRSYVWNTQISNDPNRYGSTWADSQHDYTGYADLYENPNNDYYYKDLPNYESPYGSPIATWKYLNDRYHSEVANTWIDQLGNCFHIDGRLESGKGWVGGVNDATDANVYLKTITDPNNGLDNQFVYAYKTYGEKAAFKFAKHFVYTAGMGVTLETWLVDPGMAGGVYKPINIVTMSNDPVAMANIPVAAKTTLQVNGVAKTFDVMTLHNTTYFKLSDLANTMGFKYHEYDTGNGETNYLTAYNACISNGAKYTLNFQYTTGHLSPHYYLCECGESWCQTGEPVELKANDILMGNTAGTEAFDIIVNGKKVSLRTINGIDALGNGDRYFRLRDIAMLMNFNVSWTATTGTTISNKANFDEGLAEIYQAEYDAELARKVNNPNANIYADAFAQETCIINNWDENARHAQ